MATNFTAIKTSTEYITRYTYTSGSAKLFFNSDLEAFQRNYGTENVKWGSSKGKKFIEVTQSLLTEEESRPFKTDSF